MTQLWDLSHIQPQHEVVLSGETIPALFWNAVTQRGPTVWMRQKHLGLWRSWTWNQTAQAVREIAHGLMAIGLAPGERTSILANTVVGIRGVEPALTEAARGGRVRALAVTTAKRSSALPDVPTLNETILPGFDVGTWFGLLAPAKTPSDIVNKLSAEVTKIVNIPEVKSQLLATGAEPVGNTSAEMSAQIKKELDSFATLLKQIKLTVE